MKSFRTKYEHWSVVKSFKDVTSLTDQQYKNDTTVEGIISKYGVLPPQNVQPIGLDCSAVGSFAECMDRYHEGVAAFESLPSNIRERFANSPKAFYEFLADPSNVSEAVRLGLMVERKPEKSTTELLEDIANNTKPVTTVPVAQ